MKMGENERLLAIGNGNLRATVSTTGAQLMSLALDGSEYLWQGDARWWPRRAPVLFPIVGSLHPGTVSAAGPCPMGRHGVARNQTFRVVEQEAERVVLECAANEETLAAYPYRFRLRMSYAVKGPATIEQRFEVENEGGVAMPYVVGGHPAFALPLGGAGEAASEEAGMGGACARGEAGSQPMGAGAAGTSDEPMGARAAEMSAASNSVGEQVAGVPDAGASAIRASGEENAAFEECVLEFARAWSACSPMMVEGELLDFGQPIPVIDNANCLTLRRELFATDTIVLSDVPGRTVTLRDARDGRSVRLDFPGFDYLGIWSAAHGAAPFVAIEPWCGCATATDEGTRLEQKRGMRLLAPGATATHAFTMTLA